MHPRSALINISPKLIADIGPTGQNIYLSASRNMESGEDQWGKTLFDYFPGKEGSTITVRVL